MKFLITQDRQAAEELKKLGFQVVSQIGSTWQFLNNEKLQFSHVPNVCATNKMFM